MKAKYLIEVEVKKGEDIPTAERVRTAIYGCGKQPDSIRAVDITMATHDTMLGNDLFAYAWKDGGKWVMLDYFNAHVKAANAVKRARINSLRAFKKDVEFAVFQFNPNTFVWEKC